MQSPSGLPLRLLRDPNGCVVGCEASHRRGPLAHVEIPNHPWHGGVDWRTESLAAPVSYELNQGDGLAWHRYFVHGSGANIIPDARCAMVTVFVDATQPHLQTTDRADFTF